MPQLDIQKAYDNVNWFALECILKELAFPIVFVNWVMVDVSSVSYKFNIGGMHTKIMKSKRGLRKGNPISPLLFVIVMEYFHRSVHRLRRFQTSIFMLNVSSSRSSTSTLLMIFFYSLVVIVDQLSCLWKR